MDTLLSFSLKDAGMFLLWAGLTLVAWYLVLILHKVYKTVSEVQQLVNRNKEQVDATLMEVPQITRNVQEITTEVSHGLQVFRPAVDNVAETSDSITGVIKENESITETLVSFFNVVTTVKNILDKLNDSSHTK